MVTAPAGEARPGRHPAAFPLEVAGDRPGALIRAGELTIAVVTAAAVSAALQVLVARLPIPHPSNVPRALLAVTGLAVLAVLITMAAGGARSWGRVHTALAWAGLSAVGTLTLAFPLQGTLHYLGGTAIDQEFRLQFLTRMTASPALADMNYAGLPTYYPAGWFWLGGRLAAVAGVPGWEMYKPWAILTMAVTSAVVFTAWSVSLPRRTALLAALATAIVGIRVGAPEPYSWLIAALLPPVAVIAWRAVVRPARARTPVLLGLGGFIGLGAAVYTLLGAVTALHVVVLAAFAGGTGRVPWPVLVRRVALVAVAALPLTLPQWGPFLLAWVSAGMPGGAATRFLPPGSAQLPLPMVGFSVLGALCLAGAVWLAVTARHSPVAQGLVALVGTCYGWFGLSTLTLAAGQTLLPFRLEPVLLAVFSVAGVLGLAELVRRLRPRVPPAHAGSVTAVAVVLALAATLSLVQTAPNDSRAYQHYYPSGRTPLGASDPARAQAWTGELTRTITAMTGRSAEELVVLSSYTGLLSFVPFRGFQMSTPHYANPLADHVGRGAEIQAWAEAPDSAALAAALDRSPYRPPTVFVLSMGEDGTLHLPQARDRFPREPNIAMYEVTFRRELFAGPQFRMRTVGPFVVAVRN